MTKTFGETKRVGRAVKGRLVAENVSSMGQRGIVDGKRHGNYKSANTANFSLAGGVGRFLSRQLKYTYRASSLSQFQHRPFVRPQGKPVTAELCRANVDMATFWVDFPKRFTSFVSSARM